MGHIVVLGHSENPPLSVILPILGKLGHRHSVVRMPFAEPLPQMETIDGVIILGAPVGIYQWTELDWLRREIVWVEQAVTAQKPVFGICFGCQMLAHILGGTVFKGEKPREWGFTPVQSTAEVDTLFGTELASTCVFQAHGDTYTLPQGAKHLLQGEVYAQQAAKFAENVYGVQFHPELCPETISRWWHSRKERGAHQPGDPELETLLQQAQTCLPPVHQWLERMLTELFPQTRTAQQLGWFAKMKKALSFAPTATKRFCQKAFASAR